MKSLLLFIVAVIVFLQDLLEKLSSVIDLLYISLIYILKTLPIALAGGFADYLITMKENKEEFSLKKAMLNTFIAGFAGFLTIQLCNYFKIEPNMMGFLCGISGFAGVRALRFFEKLTKKISENLATLRFVPIDKTKDNTLQLKEEDNKEKQNETEKQEEIH